MKKLKLLLSVALVFISIFTIFGGATVSANSNDAAVKSLYQKMVEAKGQDIDKFLSSLSPADQKLALEILTPTSVEVEKNVGNSALTDTQTTLTTNLHLYNVFHMELCQFIQTTVWVWNGMYITQPPQCYRAGQTYMIGWAYNGLLSHTETGGQGYTSYYAYAQANFTLVVSGIVVNHWYPAIGHTVRGNGTYTVYTYA